MPFVEVFSPPGAPRPEQRSRIAERLVAEVMTAEGAPDTPHAREISWLVWHDAIAWSVGGAAAGNGAPPRYAVRVSVPAASLTDAKRSAIVERVTRVLADADDDPDRFYSSIAAFVLVNEVPEGNWGGVGRVVRFPEIAHFVMTGLPGSLPAEEVAALVGAGSSWTEGDR
jgi:phenylpyruvate tautomerase PptA (4-oxalocrotonate tautomerase family)